MTTTRCVRCRRRAPAPDYLTCSACLKYSLEMQRALRAERERAGLCIRCGERPRDESQRRRKSCSECLGAMARTRASLVLRCQRKGLCPCGRPAYVDPNRGIARVMCRACLDKALASVRARRRLSRRDSAPLRPVHG